MRKALLLGLGLVGVAGSSAFAYWRLLPAPEPPPVPVEHNYEDIERGEYEKWMQDLGYTE
ncbi:MAG: hypothetical protein Q8P18_14660 [Pseudomonadota bacterium]|nr:hypothetical protein [Pseudomonadota bacterium]